MAKKQYNVKTSAVAATERRARKYGVAGGSVGAGGYIDVAGDVAGKLDRDVFESMFERVVTGTDDEGNETWYILAKAALVSVGDMTAYGYGGTSGDTPSPGVTELRCLDDVILDNPEAGQILKYDGSHWINAAIDAGLDESALAAYLQTNHYAKASDIPSLVGYATQTWVEGKSYATEAWVNAKGYLTQHQDISHLLPSATFEAMFERVENEDGSWYIKAKSHLAVMGDVTAYFADGSPGGSFATSLADLTDVELGSLMAGDTIKWDGQKWINAPAPGGGLDESQLAAYLTANNYVTSAVLGNYVTIDTEQTISGKKTFGADETFFTRRATINGDFSGPENCPHIMWHVPNKQFTKMLMDVNGNLHLLWGGDTNLNNYRGLTVSSIARYGGTASQFLKADGSVDGTAYATIANLDKYLYNFGANDFDPATYDGNYVGMTTKSGISGHWWHILSIGWGDTAVIGNKTWVSQLALPTQDRKGVYYRAGNGAPAYGGWTKLVDASGDTMTGPLKVPSIELTTISGIEFTNNILGGGGDVAKMYITGTGEAQQLTFEVQNDADDIINFITPDNNGLKKNGNTIWHAGNDGSGSGLDADLLDGRHGDSYLGCRYLGGQSDTHGAWVVLCPAYAGSLTNGGWFYGSVTITRGGAGAYNAKTEVLVQCGGQYDSNQGGYQVLYANVSISGLHVISYNGTRYIALGMDGVSTMEFRVRGQWSGVEPFLIDSAASGLSYVSAVSTTPHISTNSASATKLQTARTLYITSYDSYRAGDGVAFDGTGDVMLKLPNSITASDWFRSYGASGWYSESYGGGIYMQDAVWLRIFNQKSLLIEADSSKIGAYGFGVGVKIYNPSHIAFEASAGSFTMGLGCHSNGHWYWYRGASDPWGSSAKSYVMDYDGATWKFTGNIVATGDVTAYSDARGKQFIRPLENRGGLRPVTYVKDGKQCIGFVAQEALGLYPELVHDDGTAKHWLSFNYMQYTAVLQVQIDDHEARIKRLEERR